MSTRPAELMCPSCHAAGALAFEPDLLRPRRVDCAACGRGIHVRDFIPDLAPHLPEAPGGPAQRLMNSRPFAWMYETPLWRPFLAELSSGLPAEREEAEVLAASEDAPDGPILDVAAGTGHYARAFAVGRPGRTIWALDVSPGMLRLAHDRARGAQLSHVVVARGDIYHLPLADASVAVVNCGGALHLFTDLEPIWREIYRVLKPGGIFTAFTIGLAPGPLRRLQHGMMAQGRATFFDAAALGGALGAAGFTRYTFRQSRVSLVFSARRPLH